MRVFLMALLLSFMSAAAWAQTVMTAQDAREAALAGELTVVDIRRPEEWAQTGLPDVAHAMDMTEEGFAARLVRLYRAHPDRPMAIICATGGRSSYVVTALRERGLDRLLNIREGMIGGPSGPGWLAKNLPVRRPEQPRVSR